MCLSNSHAPDMVQAVATLSDAGLTACGVAMRDPRGEITAIVMHNGEVRWCVEDATNGAEGSANGSDSEYK